MKLAHNPYKEGKMAKYKVELTGVNTNDLLVLSEEEQKELFIRLKNGDESVKERLIEGNLKLVLSSLRGFRNYNVNLDDLFQVGVVGLIKAIDNFDLSYNLKLSTYGIPLIIGEIKRYLRDNQSSLRVSRGIKEKAYRILKFKEEYLQKNGVEPTYEIISQELHMTFYEISVALDALKEPASIYEPIYCDGNDDIYLFDQLQDKQVDNENRDQKLLLKKALQKLKEREKKILLERYLVGKTQVEIAESLNISQAQVSRIEKQAIRTLRIMMK